MYGRFGRAWATIQRMRAARAEGRDEIAAMAEEPPRDGVDRWPDLTNGGLFNMKLMSTYNWVILAIIVFVGIRHWYGQIRRWRRRRTARLIEKANATFDQDALVQVTSHASAIELAYSETGSSSSGSSTLDVGDIPVSTKIDDEDSPVSKKTRRKFPLGAWDRWRSFLAYQPAPIPFFNKTLPSNGQTIAGTLFVLMNLFYLVAGIKFRELYVVVFGDRASLVFIYNLPLLYLLGAKTQPLTFVTGYSYESLNIIHRRLGEILCFCGFTHSLFMFISYFTFLSKVGFTLYTFIFNQTVLTGIAALIVYETLYFTSLASFRARWYEIFLGIHVVFQAAALALLYFHHRNNSVWVLIALIIFVVDRLVYRIGMKSTHLLASLAVADDERTVILTAAIPYRTPGIWARTLGHEITHGWAPTDHVFLTAPALGRRHMLQAHPFTILSPSPRSLTSTLAEGDVMNLELLIRAYDGFTSDLLKFAFMNKSLKVRIDGPYGGSHARDVVEEKSQSILIAGGSGIAVIWPIVHFLLSRYPGQKADTEAASRGKGAGRITFIWVVQQRAQLSWLSERDIEEIKSMGAEVIIPPPTQEAGRPDLQSLIRERVEENVEGSTGVVGSGPDSMGRQVRNTCAELIGEGRDVEVLIEKFGW